jgi:hypothetical protein
MRSTPSISLAHLASAGIFGMISVAVFIPTNYLVLSGILIYLWLVPLVEVPVIVFQAVSIIVSGMFSLSLAWISTEIVLQKSIRFQNEKISIAGHFLRLSVFLIALIDGTLYFWNFLGMISALVLIWFGKSRKWRIVGVAAWIWTLLVQIYIFLTFGV